MRVSACAVMFLPLGATFLFSGLGFWWEWKARLIMRLSHVIVREWVARLVESAAGAHDFGDLGLGLAAHVVHTLDV